MRLFYTIMALFAIGIFALGNIAKAKDSDQFITHENYHISIVTSGRPLNKSPNITTMTDGSTTALAQFVGCEIEWVEGDEFYLISVPDRDGLFVVKRDALEVAWRASGQDFDNAVKQTIQHNQMCIVTGFQFIK